MIVIISFMHVLLCTFKSLYLYIHDYIKYYCSVNLNGEALKNIEIFGEVIISTFMKTLKYNLKYNCFH